MSRIQKKGFTLIELLVVVAIIALLAAILFPAFGLVREKARQSSCASNLKQIGMGILQYVQDADERLPNGTQPNTAYADHGAGWAQQILPYIKDKSVYLCPDEEKPADTVSYIGNANLFASPASYVRGVEMDRIVLATEMTGVTFSLTDTYMYDQTPTSNGLTYNWSAGNYNNYFGGSGGDVITGSLAGYPTGVTGCLDIPVGRHSGGANYLLADGHVKWLIGSSVSPGQNAAKSTNAEVVGEWGNAAGTAVSTYGATFSGV